MANSTMALNSQQLAAIEQIVIDRDEKKALSFVTELYNKSKAEQTGCDPIGMRIREGLDTIVSKDRTK